MGMMSGKNLALSIEGRTVRMLTFSGQKVQEWYNVDLNPGWVKGGIISRTEEVGKAIEKAIEENNTPCRGVLCGLSSSGSSAQVLTLPVIKKGKVEDVVGRELRRLSPGSTLENDYIYSQKLPKKATQQEVYALTVPKKNVLNMLEACHTAGIKIRAMELKPFALARAMSCENGILVDAEVDVIEIVIIDNAFPASFRSISVQNGDDPEAACQQLLSELPRTIEYYNRTHSDYPLSDTAPVYLSGELALDPELVMGVVEVTGREVANIEPPIDYPADFPVAQYMTHVGLMLRK